MKRSVFVSCLLFLISCLAAYAQHVKWEDRSFDHGTVTDWNSPPAVFKFTNTSKEKIMFLPMFYQREMYVEIPKRKLEPGETAEVKVYLYTNETGPFTKKATVWIDKSNDPMELTVRGNIKSLYKNALTACPSFWNHKPDEETPQVVFIPKPSNAGYGLPEKFDSTKTSPPAPLLQERGAELPPAAETFESNVNDQYDETEIISSNINDQYDEQLTEVTPKPTPQKEVVEETVLTDTVIPTPEDITQLSRDKFGVNNIVFLIDESGSMKRDKKMEMLKAAIKELVKALRGVDKITIITYAASAEVLLPTTTADKKDEIYSLIDSLIPYGWTNGVSGMNTAYETIDQHFVPDGNNQLFLATDGEFNQGDVTEGSFTEMVKLNAAKGTKLSIVGFGQNEKAVKLMKKMAESGQGNFLQILPGSTNTDVLVEEIKRNSERR
jgi:Mg-chelatase subunit ChlD